MMRKGELAVANQSYSESIPKGFKGRPAFILEASWEAKLKIVIWDSKIVANSPWKRLQDATNGGLWHGSDTNFESFWLTGRPSSKEYVFESLEDASRSSFGRLCGSANSFQSRYGSASKTQLISKSVVEWFWDVFGTNLKTFFEAFVS